MCACFSAVQEDIAQDVQSKAEAVIALLQDTRSRPTVEAAEICAEMAKVADEKAKGFAGDEPKRDPQELKLYVRYKGMADALREAERRIRANVPTPSAAEIRRQVWNGAIEIVESKKDGLVLKRDKINYDHGGSHHDYTVDKYDTRIKVCEEIVTVLIAARDAAPAPSKNSGDEATGD